MNYEHIKTRKQLNNEVQRMNEEHEIRLMRMRVDFHDMLQGLHKYATESGLLEEGESFRDLEEAQKKSFLGKKPTHYELAGPIYDLQGNIVKEPGIYRFDGQTLPSWSSDE